MNIMDDIEIEPEKEIEFNINSDILTMLNKEKFYFNESVEDQNPDNKSGLAFSSKISHADLQHRSARGEL